MPESTRNLVRTLRQQLGMTQEEFAHQIAVTVSTVNRWENSHAEPSKLAWKAIRDLARARGLQTPSSEAIDFEATRDHVSGRDGGESDASVPRATVVPRLAKPARQSGVRA